MIAETYLNNFRRQKKRFMKMQKIALWYHSFGVWMSSLKNNHRGTFNVHYRDKN